LIRVRSGHFLAAQGGLGQQTQGLEKSPPKNPKFSIFSLWVKKIALG